MSLIEIGGYVAAIMIGISLGLIGGGGSVLTMPVLVYLMGINPVDSTAYSLFVVGLTSLVGTVTYMRRQLVSYRTALLFALPSFMAVFLTRKFLVPAIPQEVAHFGTLALGKGHFIMLLFASLMTCAAYSMIRQPREPALVQAKPLSKLRLWTLGSVLGILTGTVGAGGGFLIIPALVLFAHLDMKEAIGTSLLIISINSLIGFTGDLAHRTIDWHFLLLFSSLAITGILTGSYLSEFIPGQKLKPVFGWFVLLMGCFIMLKELFQL